MAVTVDVEEWYHNCWVPEYVHPERRPPLPHELDRLLPRLLEQLDRLGSRATLFVLGEVADRIPGRIREAAALGHEIACHGDLHLRANDRSPEVFRTDIADAKAKLEDLLGARVRGFRSPEWSLRTAGNPRFRRVAECGFDYDSSLAPALGAGARTNPVSPTVYRWRDGRTLLELPPLTWAGAFRLPAGGWCGRLAPPSRLRARIARAIERGDAPVLVVHPWELVDRPLPGLLTGFARFLHEAGRRGYRKRFAEVCSGIESARLDVVADLCARRMATAVASADVIDTAPGLSPAAAAR